MNYKVSTLKVKGGDMVIIKQLKNSYVGAPRYEVTVILKEDEGIYRGAYTFIKKGYYQGEEELAKEAILNIKKELDLL